MSYNTYFSGEVTPTPVLTPEHRAELEHLFSDAGIKVIPLDLGADAVKVPQVYCPFEVSAEGEVANREGCDDSDEFTAWLEWLCEWGIVRGYTFDGIMGWNGDSSDDRGNIYLRASREIPGETEVEWVELEDPGPSWERVNVKTLREVLTTAAQYLEHPAVAPVLEGFAIPGSNVVRSLTSIADKLQRGSVRYAEAGK